MTSQMERKLTKDGFVDESYAHISITAPKFEDMKEGMEFPSKTFSLTRGDLVNYAGVSGDTNPIHYSDYIADLMGLETVCAHGMLTMGIGATLITEWINDPRAIKDFSVRFTSPVYIPPNKPGDVTYSGKIKSLDPQTRTGTIQLTVTQGNRRNFGKAVATIQFT